jgi:hypothetical protein
MARNKLSDLRDHLFEQIENIKSAQPEELDSIIKKAKAMSEVGSTIIESGKLEYLFIRELGDQKFKTNLLDSNKEPVA